MECKGEAACLGLAPCSIAAHCAILVLACNRPAIPYLPGEQKVENASAILFYVLPAKAIISFVVMSLAYSIRHEA